MGTLFKWVLLGLLGYEVYQSLGPRRLMRRRLWSEAQVRAHAADKQLIVVGDPDAGIVNRFLGRDYDCGDVCIDRAGCVACPVAVRGRLEDVLPTLETGSAVIYVSCTLEYVDDINLVARELYRVSGGDLFVATVQPWSLTAWAYPGAQRRIFEAPPEHAGLRWEPLPWSKSLGPVRYLPPGV